MLEAKKSMPILQKKTNTFKNRFEAFVLYPLHSKKNRKADCIIIIRREPIILYFYMTMYSIIIL